VDLRPRKSRDEAKRVESGTISLHVPPSPPQQPVAVSDRARSV